jgi:integrase
MDVRESTASTYGSQFGQFEIFCGRLGVPSRPPQPKALAQFIIGRALQGYKLSTIEVGVAAVAREAAHAGVSSLTTDPVVQRALKVAAQKAVRTVDQKIPLGYGDLRLVVQSLSREGVDPYIQARDTALFTVGWTGMFRSSELVGIEWGQVHFCPRGVMLFVPRSKTDPGEGAWVFLAESGQVTCPVRALRVLSLRFGQVGAVFRGRKNDTQHLSKTTVGQRLKKALCTAGVAGWEFYAAHSLRRGGATHASRSGIPLRMIQIMGRWKSDAVRQYLYTSPQEILEASATMQQRR